MLPPLTQGFFLERLAIATALFKRERLRDFVKEVFDGRADSLVLGLVEDESLSREELRSIEKKIDEAEAKRTTKAARK